MTKTNLRPLSFSAMDHIDRINGWVYRELYRNTSAKNRGADREAPRKPLGTRTQNPKTLDTNSTTAPQINLLKQCFDSID